MIKLKTKEEIQILREGGKRLASILATLATQVKPGVKTRDLDDEARRLIQEYGDNPAFLNYRPKGARLAYPAALCVSVNDEIVHGIPSQYEIKEGDVVTLDLGLVHAGLFTDSAITLAVGPVPEEVQLLLDRTKKALDLAIAQAVVGKTVGDIGFAVEQYIKPFGYGIIEDLAGHGVGYAVHEDPQIPNFGQPGTGEKLKAGMVIAIEPMITLGTKETDLLDDEYTFVSADGTLSAHFEHTIAVTDSGPIILTAL
jgi:methionyl aminopeptidase